MGSEHYCLRWNNHQSNLLGVFSQLLQDESLVDVTLACAEGHSIRAHKVVLSACSSYFQTLFVDHPNRHPIVILKDVCFAELRTLVEFMYKGEVNVEYCQLSALLKTAESLKVKGLAEMTNLNSASTSIKREREESTVDATPQKQAIVLETPPPTETVNKRLTNEDTNLPSPRRNSSPGPPSKRSCRGRDCEDLSDCERETLDTPDRNVKGGCPGPTDMSASGMALCQMPPSCSSPHVSEPFPGTSCLPPVQQVPLVSIKILNDISFCQISKARGIIPVDLMLITFCAIYNFLFLTIEKYFNFLIINNNSIFNIFEHIKRYRHELIHLYHCLKYF